MVCAGPAAHAGAFGLEVEPAMEFAGTGALGGRWFGSEQFFEQRQNFRRPSRLMIAGGGAAISISGVGAGGGSGDGVSVAVSAVRDCGGDAAFVSVCVG